MARVKQTVTTTKTTRTRKVGGNSGYHTCPYCGGSGRVRNVGRGARKA